MINVTEGEIKQLVSSKLEGSDCFIVDIKINPGKIVVLLDKPTGIKIEECADVNRDLRDKLEGRGILEKYGIEVSSPGMEEPLRVLAQYYRRIGKQMGIVTKDGMRKEGILKSADENEIVIEETIREKNNGKKTSHTELRTIPMSEIKEAKVIFKF